MKLNYDRKSKDPTLTENLKILPTSFRLGFAMVKRLPQRMLNVLVNIQNY